MKKEGIYRFSKDLRRVKRSELLSYFAAQSGRIILTKLMKSIIWQVYENIQSGKTSTISGNIRTFWYLYIKPVLSHIPGDYYVQTDPYDTMLGVFSYMVMELHLFKYSDFDFTDENWENRRIGTTNPHILLFAEKRGWVRFLREQNQRFGVSTIAIGGAPSALTSEYTVKAIQQTKLQKPVRLVGIVDYDPSGDLIAHAFKKQLIQAGVGKITLTTLIHPKYYTERQIEMFQFPLPSKQKTKTDNWLKKTKGIYGRPFGLESESMPRNKLSNLVKRKIQPHLNI